PTVRWRSAADAANALERADDLRAQKAASARDSNERCAVLANRSADCDGSCTRRLNPPHQILEQGSHAKQVLGWNRRGCARGDGVMERVNQVREARIAPA